MPENRDNVCVWPVNFLQQFWKHEREYTLSWTRDLYGSSLVIVGLMAIRGLLRVGLILGWLDIDEVTIIGKVHLAISVGAVLLIGYFFLGKLLFNRTKELSRSRPSGR